jgi:hypothetical protein
MRCQNPEQFRTIFSRHNALAPPINPYSTISNSADRNQTVNSVPYDTFEMNGANNCN